ncbi:MAG: hypothetical protein ACOCXZ_03245 [Chloroflexota bacterium]
MEQQEKIRPVTLTIREDGIFVFKFTQMNTEAIEKLEKIMLAAGGKFPPGLRTLWDLRESSDPTREYLRRIKALLSRLELPRDARTAHVVRSVTDSMWIRIARSGLVERDNTRSFTDFDSAVAWLRS